MSKKAVVLFNLGGPDKQESVKNFLFNLFYDPAIISLPNPFRFLLAKFISSRREKKAQGIYAKIGGGSPIGSQTQAQAAALENMLGDEYKVFICMRYWHPMAAETVKDVMEYNPDQVILLPLYPQFSSTTTASSFKNWNDEAEKVGLKASTKTICCYHANEDFCTSFAELINPLYLEASKLGKPRLLFSAHGIPINRIQRGDPYEWQTHQTVAKVMKHLALDNPDYTICYQSKVGPLKWLSPSTEHEIEAAAKDKRPIVVAPITFVSEHSETLVELDIEYKDVAQKNGAAGYFRVPTVQADELFIKSLADLVRYGESSTCSGIIDMCKTFQ